MSASYLSVSLALLGCVAIHTQVTPSRDSSPQDQVSVSKASSVLGMKHLLLCVLDLIDRVLDHLFQMFGTEIILEVAEEPLALAFHARILVCHRLCGGLC